MVAPKPLFARVPEPGETFEGIREVELIPSIVVERTVRHDYKAIIHHNGGVDTIYVDEVRVFSEVIEVVVAGTLFGRPLIRYHTRPEIARAVILQRPAPLRWKLLLHVGR